MSSFDHDKMLNEMIDAARQTIRLTEAAPDLLGALRELLAINDSCGPFGGELLQDRIDRAWHKARAAIAKAEGR